MRRAIVVLLAYLVLLGMIASPVAALGYQISPHPLSGDINYVPGKVTAYSIDVSQEGKAIHKFSIDIPTGTSVNFTVTYGNGLTASGWMAYTNNGFYQQHSEVSIEGNTNSYDYVGVQEIGRIDVVGYARNYTTTEDYTMGFIVYDTVFGITQFNAMAYYEVPNLSENVIYKFEIASNNPVTVTYYTDTRANVAGAATTTPAGMAGDWINNAIKYAGAIGGFIISLFWILKFFFIDNLLLIVAMWISVSMAYSAISSRDIFAFYKKFFRTQKLLIEFIIALWDMLIRTLNALVQMFVKWL